MPLEDAHPTDVGRCGVVARKPTSGGVPNGESLEDQFTVGEVAVDPRDPTSSLVVSWPFDGYESFQGR